jgi:copper(I)-binding protein
MNRSIIQKFFIVIFSICCISLTNAQTKLGNLQISKQMARATAPGQSMSSAYLLIENKGSTPDRLLTVTYSRAKEVQIHEMKMEGDKMMMRQMTALEIPANGSVELKSGGYHLMMLGLQEPIKEGDSVKMTLQFEKAGKVDISFQTKSMAGMKH